MTDQWGERRGTGRWERLLTDLDEWTYLLDLLPAGASNLEYKALHRAVRNLANDGLLSMVTLPKGAKRSIVGPAGTRMPANFRV